MNDNATDKAEAETTAQQAAAQIIDSPLFSQIVGMMTVCTAAKALVDKAMLPRDNGALTPEDEKALTELLVNLATHLAQIDFDHGQEIVAGALDACRLTQPGVDLVCSGFNVGMPPKKHNQQKVMFIRGGIASNKSAMIFLDQKGAEQCIKDLTNCLDILYPQRLVGIGATPPLVVN